MKKILFLIPNLSYGGAEKVLVNLVNNMDKEQYKVTVQTLFDVGVNKKYLKEEVCYRSVFKRQFRGNSHVFKLFSPAFLFRRFIKEKYDIIVSYLEGPAARIVSGCRDNNTKTIAWIHTEQFGMKLAAAAFRNPEEAKQCYARFDNIVCVSKTVLEDFVSIFDYKGAAEVLYNTNETKKITELSTQPVEDIKKNDGEFLLCCVARLRKSKGFDRLARIHKKLLSDGIKHRICVLGLGEEKEKIENYLKENGLTGTFQLLGYRENPYKYIALSDLYVCSSLMEGFSTAVTEALVVGTPVVTTLCSGMEELLEENEYGLITENSEDALYRGIKKVLTCPELLAHYREQAKTRGGYFSTGNTVCAVEEMFERIGNDR